MESENIHSQHQLQEEFSFGAYSPLLATQSSYKAASAPSSNNLHDWNTNTMLNGSSYNTYLAETIPNSKDLWPKCSAIRDPSTQNYGSSNAHELLLEKLKEEASISPFRAWSTSHETIHRSSSAQELEKHNPWSNNSNNNHPFGHHFTGSSSHPNSDAAKMYLQETASFSRSYNFSNNMGLPRSHISTADLTSSLVSSSLSLNLEAFDFLRSANYDGGSSNSLSSNANLGYYKDQLAPSSGHDDHMQELRDPNSPPNNSFKRSASLNTINGAPATKKPNGGLPKQKEAHGEAKKSRVVARSSCPPLKVRKEKLGDRIAALQKLVAPFGKTDTASVLTEAIGYIQFLHDQVQTLSVPYMKSTRGDRDDGRGGDLRSGGLCLVPQSCASYINDYI